MKHAMKMMVPVIVKGSGNMPKVVRDWVRLLSKLLPGSTIQAPAPSLKYPWGQLVKQVLLKSTRVELHPMQTGVLSDELQVKQPETPP